MAIASNFPAIRPSLDLNFAAGNFDPRITFSRASAATYYDGKTVAKAEENLLKYSQAFDLGWSNPNSIVTPNAVTAPDGTVTAALVYPSSYGARSIIWQAVSSIGRTYTYSIYAKYSGKQWVSFQTGESGAQSLVWWDVLNGVMGSTNGQSASISSAGNGWYRLTITRVADGIFTVWAVCDSDGSDVATVSGTNGVLFWGAQTEERAQVTAYTPTTTQPITNYIPVLQTALSGVPRIDHDPVTGECKGLLIEEQRTNLLTYSEQFSVAPWTRGANDPLLVNSVVSPAGDTTGDTLVTNSVASVYHGVYVSVAGVTPIGTPATFSVHLKANGYNFVELRDTANAQFYARFDLVNGVVTAADASTTAKIVPTGDGWFRASVTFSVQTSGAVVVNILTRPTDTPFNVFSGDGYSGFHIWGAQLEAGSFPTSYIKTEASQVTRAADFATMTGANFSSWYRQDEGTMFVESTLIGIGAYATYPVLTYGVNTVSTVGYSSSINLRGLKTNNGGATDVDLNLPTSQATNKTAMATASNDVVLSANGLVSVQDAFSSIPALNGIAFVTPDSVQVVGAAFIKRVSFYPKRLTDAQLQALTA